MKTAFLTGFLHEKGSYNFKWIRCINDILVALVDLIFLKLSQSITQIL